MNMKLAKNRTFKRMLINILSIFVILAMAFPATGSVSAQEPTVAPALAGINILVNTSEDELNADGDCSLREAIQAANTDTAVDACAAGAGADVLDLPAGTYYLSISGLNEDGNLSGDLDIASDVSVQGEMADTTIIDGGALDRVLDVVSGTVMISGLTVRNGSSNSGGGGILNRGTLTLEATTVTANTATFMIGGGIKNEAGATMMIHGSTISGNTTEIHHGGGIVNLGSMTIDESIINDNASNTDGGGIDSRGPLTIRSSVIRGNHAYGLDGGGIYSEALLILENTIITENTASQAGGGVASSGTLEATNITVQNNSASAHGGGLSTSTAATANIVNSTISGNTATYAGGGLIHWFGLLTLTNSTVSSNTAEFGGGIYDDHLLVLSNSTISDNTASMGGGLLIQQNPPWGYQSVATVKNTILANNTLTNCEGIFTSAGFNIIEDVAGCNIIGDLSGNITGLDPLLDSLQDNGGPTQTHALLPDSPAIDAGNPAGCTDSDGNPLEVDQRGEPRPVDGNNDGTAICDIGAYEAGEVPPSTYIVNTTDDDNDGTCDEIHCSLREAIHAANAKPAVDTIVFNIDGEPPFTIRPESPFEDLYDTVMIDGTTQPRYAGSPIIELDGTNAGEGTNGLVLAANDSLVKGLVINRFSGNGVILFGHGNTIQNNYIGTDITGTLTTGPAGPTVDEPTVTVMDGTCPTYDAGTNIDGFVSESNDPMAPWSGISVHFKGTEEGCGSPETNGAASLIYRYKLEFADEIPLTSVMVSGAAFNGPDNILRALDENMNVLGTTYTYGGNSFQTPYIRFQNVVGRVFYIDEFDTSSSWRYRQSIVINGPLPLGNYGNGVLIANGATDNQVIENLISGNIQNGVAIFNPGTTGNVVQENKIGTDITGTQPIGNAAPGVGIGDQAYNNFIIGNLISGNRSDGVAIFNPGTNGNTLQGNNIGTDIDREVAIPNQGVGVWIGEGASNTVIGGDNASVRNVISGNRWGGVSINQAETTGTIVQGNYIGTDKNGDVALPNGGDGVYISGSENMIGGSEPGAGNVISGNTASGVSMAWGASGNLIQGNFIGTDLSGTSPLYSASGPEFGHYELEALPETCPTYDAGTSRDAFVSESSDPLAPWSGTSVMFMGTDEDKCGIPETFEGAPLIYRYKLTFDEPTELTSIAVSGAAFNGGALRVLDENMDVLGIAYNFGGNSFQTNYVRLSGVVGQVFFIEEYDYSSDWRYRESIVINGPLPVGNSGSGVNFNNGASNNLVVDNLISGNRSDAVSLYHTGTNGNILQGNYIGTDVSGTVAVPNASAAIWIGEGASNTVIGGIEEGQGNIVSGNTGDAISINNAETTGTVIQGNFIGTDVTGSVTLPNLSNGIVLVTGTHDNLIGGTEPGSGNVISGNWGDGVILVDGGTSGNSVQNNFIGTDLTGTIALGNGSRGVYLGGGAADNLIGGNVISGNGAAGIRLADSGTTGNEIQGNFIGTDITGLNPLGNGYFGVRITDGAGDNLIGGKETGAGNVIAFNADSGIALNPDAGLGNALLSNLVFSNGGFGIDLAEDGVTANDVLDQDSGPNALQNYPYIAAVTRMSTFARITGLLVTAPKATYRVEFFSNNSCDPSGSGEGQTFLGYTVINTNPVGIANFSVNLPVVLTNGAFITATATDATGNTSEFSQCFGPIK